MTGTLVTKAASFLEARISRRSVIGRSAFIGSALAVGGADFALAPSTAYAFICSCGNPTCGCGSTCCIGFTEFCCVLNGGYNFCPAGSTVGGWWRANGSAYCSGPRYYLDCNANCNCTTGCGGGGGFCSPGCDGLNCECALGQCTQFLTGCLQFRYGQCNQDVACLGRIQCRVVSCIPPWEIDPSCGTTNAEDDGTANQNSPCNTAVPNPPPPPCVSPATKCEVVSLSGTGTALGYWMVTSFGKVFGFGNAFVSGDLSLDLLAAPIVGIAGTPTVPPSKGGAGSQTGVTTVGAYRLVAADGGIFCFGGASYHGSMGGRPLDSPIVAMVPTSGGKGYWLVAADGGVFAFGQAQYHGSMGGRPLDSPIVGMAVLEGDAGYWLVAADGGIFAFGSAPYFGSMGGKLLAAPVVGIAAAPGDLGYWLAGADGGVFCFGDSPFEGSEGGQPLGKPVVGIASASTPNLGYWLVAQDGAVFSFDAPFHGTPTS